MSPHEEELQRNAELRQLTETHPDRKAYQVLFEALKKPVDYSLSPGFTDQVLTRIVEKKKKESVRDLVWLTAGVFLLVVSFVVALVMTDFTLSLGFLKGMSSYAGVFLFGILFIGLLNWIDHRLRKSPEEFKLSGNE